MKVIFVGKNKEIEVKGLKSVLSFVKEFGISLEVNVFIKNGEIVVLDDVFSDNDIIEIIFVVFGG